MLKLVDGLARAAVGSVLLPIDAAVDLVTLGGELTDSESQLAKRAAQISGAIDDAVGGE